MRTILIKQISAGLLYGVLFLLLFKSQESPAVYFNTLGRISANYEFFGDYNHNGIKKVKKPFAAFDEQKLIRWDAVSYNCIKERLYDTTSGCDNKVRPAYFPLFPLVWKATDLSPTGISVLNYLFLVSALLILVNVLVQDNKHKIFLFLFLLMLPQSIYFLIPYTEATFLLCMALAIAGIMKGKRWLYALGAFGAAITRPASVFFLVAILLADLFFLARSKNKINYFKDLFLRASPFILGYFLVFSMQYYYTHDWLAVIHAQSHWAKVIYRFPNKISDWSLEGFATSSFAICCVCFPLMIFGARYLFINKTNDHPEESLFSSSPEIKKDYVALFSAFYFIMMCFFIGSRNGGDLHSLSRLTLASPAFYLPAIILFERIQFISARRKQIIFIISLLILVVFFALVEYGGNRFHFPYLGMFILILASAIFYLIPFKNEKASFIALSIVGLINLFWLCYLFNDFLSAGWIFT